jgi:glutathione S-transferase
MRRIYHLVTPSDWESAGTGPYRAASLATEGFIHCSNRDQVARVANLFYADAAELLVLAVEVNRLTSPARDEDAGTGERFPHVYGPLDRDAIVAVERLQRGPDRHWILPDSA